MYDAVWCREDGLNSNSSSGIGSDWFEGALVRPDLVLSDVARALNSSAVPQVCIAHSLSTPWTKLEGTVLCVLNRACGCANMPNLV